MLVGYNIGRIYTFEGIAKVINCFTLIMCLLFIIIAIFSDFEKISIPPDSHALIVFTSMYFIYHLKNKSKVLLAILILSIVGLGSFLSFHRITFLSFLFAFIAVYVIRNKFILFSMTSVLVYAFIDNYYIVADFFELVISQPDLVLDLSASQRIKESILIYNTLINKEIVLLGAGFGAFYYNTDLIQHYPEFVHQGHVSPMMLLFRNGVIGFLMYMILVFFSGYCVFDRSKKVFIFSSALLFSMFASLFDFYFYWGTHLGILIGLLIYYRKNEKTS
ncbi:MAG: hypothetical protein GJ671_01915 [Alteromonadaceae bacterium]|nr:hypothetical protein [Alteromonadaceae bacterium]